MLDKKPPTGDHYCPNLEGRDEFDLHKNLVNFKNQLVIENKKLDNDKRLNPSLSCETSCDSIEKKCYETRSEWKHWGFQMAPKSE